MLPRVLEPEVMDSEAEARDYDTMDHSTVNRAFASDFLVHFDRDGPILDVGAGTAQIPIELCRQHSTLHVVAIDASPAMLRLAQANIDRAGLTDRIRVQLVDAKRLPFVDGTYAAVVSNSIVHHIPEPRSVLAEIVRVTAAGGWIFVRDLLRPEDDVAVRRLVDLHAAGANRAQRDLFEASLRAALTVDEVRSLVAEVGGDPAAVRQTTDRHWTWSQSQAQG
jgi:ubiquinone/menaquinone biosynthesis C-methylase UbiE